MRGTISVKASDVEPGAVVVTVTPINGGAFILRGADLERFAEQFGRAYVTVLRDLAAKELKARQARPASPPKKTKAVMMAPEQFRRQYGGGRVVIGSHRNGGKPWRR